MSGDCSPECGGNEEQEKMLKGGSHRTSTEWSSRTSWVYLDSKVHMKAHSSTGPGSSTVVCYCCGEPGHTVAKTRLCKDIVQNVDTRSYSVTMSEYSGYKEGSKQEIFPVDSYARCGG